MANYYYARYLYSVTYTDDPYSASSANYYAGQTQTEWDGYTWNGTKYIPAGSSYLLAYDSFSGYYLVSDSYAWYFGTRASSGDGGYYYAISGRKRSSHVTKGSYVDTIIAADGMYPNDGVSGSYWYVKGALAFPSMKIKVDGVLKTSIDGWVKIDGVLRHIDSMWTNIGGVLKKL